MRLKVAAHCARKKIKKLLQSTQTHGGKEKFIMFNLISKREKERRISKAREHLIKRTVGSYTRDFVLTTWAAREQVFENTVKCLLLNSSPLDDKVSPLKLENVVRKVPEIKKSSSTWAGWNKTSSRRGHDWKVSEMDWNSEEFFKHWLFKKCPGVWFWAQQNGWKMFSFEAKEAWITELACGFWS